MNHRVTTKEQILACTMEIALRDGVDRVSIRKLAKACNIAVGSVYNYYPNKEALITAVAEEFWNGILENQEQLYWHGMGFTDFLEQYYSFLYGRLSGYDRSWLTEIDEKMPKKYVAAFILRALTEDERVNPSIWNMELNEEIFCEYVLTNMLALLQMGENNCRFFIILLEHLLYDS